MANEQTIRAWKARRYREGLSRAQRRSLPEHPAGTVDLPDSALEAVGRGVDSYLTHKGCLTMSTYVCGSCGITIRAL